MEEWFRDPGSMVLAMFAALPPDPAPETLLAQLIAAERTAPSVSTAVLPTPISGSALATALAKDAEDIDTDGSPELPFTARKVAVIAVRIARGETRTEVVRAMPGYATRRHREFVAYYAVIAAALDEEGMLPVRSSIGPLSEAAS
jgi:hypothetical protein